MKPIPAYWWSAQNFGDTLTRPMVEALSHRPVELTDRFAHNKLIGIGSILGALSPGDTVWGAGWHKHKQVRAYRSNTFLALRGPLTYTKLSEHRPKVQPPYGDPALLLPLIYAPQRNIKHKVGILPHYVDKPWAQALLEPGQFYINVQNDWRQVIEDICSCEEIHSSSLHGLIAADAYGVKAKWVVYSTKIIGGHLKFDDYLLGTNRVTINPGEYLPKLSHLTEVQCRIAEPFMRWLKK